jgi:hypothetical protein
MLSIQNLAGLCSQVSSEGTEGSSTTLGEDWRPQTLLYGVGYAKDMLEALASRERSGPSCNRVTGTVYLHRLKQTV